MRTSDSATWDPSGHTLALGPDGVLYGSDIYGGTPFTIAANATFSPSANTLTAPSGTYPVSGEGATPYQAPQPPISRSWGNAGDTGIFRKVTASQAARAFSAIVFFPGSLSGLDYKGAFGDTADIYAGGSTVSNAPHPQNMDVGFEKGAMDSVVKGWRIQGFFRTAAGPNAFINDEGRGDGRALGYRFAGAARLTVQLPDQVGNENQIRITVNARDFAGQVYGATNDASPNCNITMFVDNFDRNDWQFFRFKRVNSLAQSAAKIQGANGPGAGSGWARTGSYVRGAAWGDPNNSIDTAITLDQASWTPQITAQSGAYPGKGNVVDWNEVRMQY